MTTPTPRDCEHGQLARSCEICELKRDLAAREEELAEAQSILTALDDYHCESDGCAVGDDAYFKVAQEYRVKFHAIKQRAEAAERELAALKAENSKLRSALEIVHFKREPWQ